MTHQSPGMQRHALTIVPTALLAAFALGGCGGTEEEVDPNAPATIVFVDGSLGAGLNNGTSWANAYRTLGAALTGAPAGAQLWIKAGEYKPGSARTDAFIVAKQLSLYGSFDGTETALDQRDLSDADVTLLSGDIGVASDETDNSHRILRVTAGGVVLDGIDVAFATGPTTERGAGIDVSSVSGLTLRNVIVRNCINGRTGSVGSALVLNGATNVTVRDCVLADSEASSGHGGGAYLSAGSSATFVNCVFTGLRALGTLPNGGRGAAVYADQATLTMTNCTVFDCDSASGGPVYAITGLSTPITVRNSVFAGNANASTDDSVMVTSTLYRTVTYSQIEKSIIGTGNSTTAPVFEDSLAPKGTDGRYGTADDGLRLDPASSGVGNAQQSGAPNRDITGASRGTLYDRGAYDQLSGG